MGIPTDEDDFGADCPVCFPAGQAPRVMWASFTGIKIGDLWGSGDGQPPNGVFKLLQYLPCYWRYLSPLQSLQFLNIGISAGVFFHRVGTGTMFFNLGGAPCIYFFANQNTNPVTTKFYGGLCSISFVSPDTGPGIQRVMSGLNLKPDPKTFAEVIPVSQTVNTYRIARKKDGTNVNIKFDYS